MFNLPDPLRTRKFLPFFLTFFGGAFNDALIRRAIEILITFQGLSGAIAPEIAIFSLLTCFMLPFFICSAFAGYLADIKPKEDLIRVIKICEVFIILMASYGIISHSLVVCIIAITCLGIHSSFFGPVKFSLPPQHLETGELIKANGLIEAGTNLAILSATIFGGIIITLPMGTYLVSITAILMSILGICASFYIPSAPPTGNVAITRKSSIQLISRLISDRDLFLISLGISWFWTLGAILISIFSLVVKDIIHGPELFVTIFFTVFSTGVGVGSLLCNRILKGQISAIWVPLSAIGMAIGLLAFYMSLPSPEYISNTYDLGLFYFISFRGIIMLSALLLISISGGIFIVPLYGLMQKISKKEERSQIIAGNNILNALMMVAGSVLLSLLFKIGVSLMFVVLILVALNLLVAIYACLLLPEELLKSILQVMFKSVFRAKVEGLENFSKAGARTLVVSNHLSFLDAVMLGAFSPARVAFAVNTEISKMWWMKPAMACFDLIPIDPANPMAMRILIDKLKNNQTVVIFPEGRITVTGALMKIYEGPAMIADKANAVLLPVRLDGFQFTFFSRVKNILRWKFFPRLSMTICEPTRLVIPEGVAGRAKRIKLAIALSDLMTEMIFKTNERGPTLLHSLRSIGSRIGRSKIVVRDALGGTLTYGALFKKSFVLSKLIPKSLGEVSNIGLLLPNGVPMLLLLFSCHWNRKTPALLNFSHTPEQLEVAVKVSGLKTVITSKKFVTLAKLDNHLQRFRDLKVEIVYLEDISANSSKYQKLRALLDFSLLKFKAIVNRVDYIQGEAEDSAVILFTSGSEGLPKGVVLSHSNILNNIDQVTSTVPLVATDSVFNALPMFHSFGLTGGTLMPIMKGVPVYLYPSPLHYKIIPELVYSESSTILFGTPTFLAGYAKAAHSYDFFSVRYVFSGAERLPDNIRSIYHERFGLRIFEGYGATETSPVIAVNNPFYTKAGTVGRILPGISYRLEEIPGVEEGGRLFVKGPNVMKGYLKIDQPNVIQPLETEWYDTGDIVAVDDKGFITIKGRAKRFAKIGGEMISLTAVEHAMELKWPTAMHAIMAVEDSRKGERLIAFSTNKVLDKESLFTALREKGIPELGFPKEIRIVASLPLLGSGKVDYQKLKAEC
jgi:acyl-[acyl-carrier-protein]-phospholipid O-acyltransferase/long-chain-fatty-acid--[acyl-carrier-protein] ligase